MSSDLSMSRNAVRARQLAALRTLVAELHEGNAFYAPRLALAGIDASLDDLDVFTSRMPLTTKDEITADQAAHPPWGSNLTYPLSSYTRFHQTSGTSGLPMRWLDTPSSWAWMLASWRRVFEAAGATPGEGVFFAFSFGPFLGFWTAYEAAAAMGCRCVPGGGMSSAARLRTLQAAGATTLCCTPTYALRLGEVAREEGLTDAVAQVRRIIVAGEPGGSVPSVRRAIENAFPQARVVDHHGMTEVGPVSYENPDVPGVLHVIEDAYLAEVLDGTTHQPVAPGQIGELVLTTLGRHGSPLLRYRTGDMVKLSQRSVDDLGVSDMALEGGILARLDDMLTVRGVNLYPSAVDEVIRRVGGCAEYGVEVHRRGAMTDVRVLVEPENGASGEVLCRRAAVAMRDAFSLRIDVTAVDPGSLPRFEMKARRWRYVTEAGDRR